MQAARPRAIVDLIRSAEQFRVPGLGSGGSGGKALTLPQPGNCERCGYISSQVSRQAAAVRGSACLAPLLTLLCIWMPAGCLCSLR
jgi:hypothetical protein